MSAARAPSLATCFLTIAHVHAVSRFLGLRRAVREAQHAGSAGGGPDAEGGAQVIDETARRVAAAAAFYPARVRCLEQSLALCTLLRRRGVDASLRIGVQPRPFAAHAWVEAGGRVINEDAEVAATFTTFTLEEV
jgi:hypothetical protein